LPPHGVLRREVAQRALDARGHVRHAFRHELGEAEVGDERREVRVQQRVAGLDVTVDDVRGHVVVQVHEVLGGAEGHVDAALPVEPDIAGELAVEVREQAEVGHVVVDDHPLVRAGGAVVTEAEQVLVTHAGKYLHLYRELHLRLGVVGRRLELLHRDLIHSFTPRHAYIIGRLIIHSSWGAYSIWA
jgi:hypothetical protein